MNLHLHTSGPGREHCSAHLLTGNRHQVGHHVVIGDIQRRLSRRPWVEAVWVLENRGDASNVMSVLRDDFTLLFIDRPWVDAVWVIETRGDVTDVMSVLRDDFTLLFIDRRWVDAV